MTKPPFEPTNCSCSKDRQNCKTQPGHLLPGQLATIAQHLKITVQEATRFFWKSPGMVLGSSRNPDARYRLPTITPRFENGSCIFYQNGLCKIHEVAPFGCRFFDVHMNAGEANTRARWGVLQILDNLCAYETERDVLPEATHYQPKRVL
jgi:Fe-S-cluster containining protein